MSFGVGTPSLVLTRVVLLSSRMMSMQSSTHSSQMNTVGPAISLRTSCWLLPQKEQYSVLLVSPLAALVMVALTPRRRRAGVPSRRRPLGPHQPDYAGYGPRVV